MLRYPLLSGRITCWNVRTRVSFSSNTDSCSAGCSCDADGLWGKAAKPQVFPSRSRATVQGVGWSMITVLGNQWELVAVGWEELEEGVKEATNTPPGFGRGNAALVLCWVRWVGCAPLLLQRKAVLKSQRNFKNASTYLKQAKPPKLDLICTLK